MTRFVGRSDLLGRLEGEFDRARARPGRLLAIRGRRQVGKSTLVEQFIGRTGVPAVFYVASRQSAERELELFTEAIAQSGVPGVAEVAQAGPLGSWEAALTLLSSAASPERPLILVIDEFPYLTESSPDIEGVLQKVWDRTLERTSALVLLVGSDLSMMRALSEYGRPLYGRLAEIVVPPLSPAEIAEMLTIAPPAALDAYLIIGGFPRLAALWRPGEGIWQFLERELPEPMSPLAVLGERVVSAEFPSDLHARAVLEAIGSGERAHGGIAKRAGLAQTSLNRALELLQQKGVVSRQLPYSSARNPRFARYAVADAYLRFWLRFIGPSLELIQRGRGDVALERIRGSWSDYRGRAVEPLVRAGMERLLPHERLGSARFVGGYWTRDNRVEVDLVGGRQERHIDVVDFVGSIKWRASRPFDRDDFAELAARRALVPGASPGTLLVGVSRAGFKQTGLDVEIGPEELLRAWRGT